MSCFYKCNKYQIKKAEIHYQAIDWQTNFLNNRYTWREITEWVVYFEKMGKRYGLLKEFRENGII